MTRLLLTLMVLLATAVPPAAMASTQCEQSHEHIRLTGEHLSAAQVEAIGLRLAAKNRYAPQVPFAYGNSEWRQLKSLFRPGDRFQAFEKLWPPTGKPFAWGYALVRGKCIVGVMGTRTA